jgi:peroxiredoxin
LSAAYSMIPKIYNVMTLALGVCVLLALAVAALSLVAMLVRWKSPKRRGHVIRLFLSLAAAVCMIAIHQAVLWLVLLPALGREQLAQINADRAAQLAASSFVHVGDQAPDFSLTDASGNTFSLQDARGKVVLINFFATWCGPCKAELPHLEEVWKRYGENDNFRMLVIGREESLDSVQEFQAANGYSFPIAPDPQAQVYGLFAKEFIPRTLIISPKGEIVFASMGFYETDSAEVEKALAQQLAGLP